MQGFFWFIRISLAFILPILGVFFSVYNDLRVFQDTLILDEIKNDVETNLLLLDEWDANLAHSNIENISQKINVIAKNICVIEVRHQEWNVNDILVTIWRGGQ